MCYVYAIGKTEHLINEEYEYCYIGVTKNELKDRWYGHTRSGYTVCEAIREFGLTFENNMVVLFEGSIDECFDLEAKFRPFPFMGLNEAKGGGRYTGIYSQERNEKISTALKGRVRTKEHSENISKTKKKLGSSKGSNNVKAEKWKLISPCGVEILLHGDLYTYCENNNLTATALRKNLGKPVDTISPKFRDYGKSYLRDRRNNTTGWTLIKE